MNKVKTKATKQQLLTFLVGMFIASIAFADIVQDLDTFVNNMNGQSSITNAQTIERQGYRYMTGGRFMSRFPSKSMQLATFKAPNYRVGGCGSIDMFLGGISFISANELVNTLQQIGSNAIPSYAFMLAMRTISSQITDTLQEAYGWMQKLNNLNTSTCEAAAWAVNSLASQELLSQEQTLCMDQQMRINGVTYSEAKERCGITQSQRNGTLNSNEVHEQAFTVGNLAWIVIDKANMFPTDLDMREVLMSITGSIIKKKELNGVTNQTDENAQNKADPLVSLLVNKYQSPNGPDSSMLDAILFGGTAEIYNCQNGRGRYECTDVTTRNVTFDNGTATPGVYADDALVVRARNILMDIFNKIRTKVETTQQERVWINSTTLPVYRLLTVGASLRGESGGMIVEEAAQAMAIDFFYAYLQQILDALQNYTNDPSLKNDAEAYRKQLKIAREVLGRKYKQAETSINRAMQMADTIRFYEQLAVASMPKNIQMSLTWSNQFNAE